ncbi:MAG: radical SAM family heme chaperone HemW [Synergistaceae bacterium]|jgi:oxygen-independent coproporphyrinogen-3 oxidase|nr:radical SAM family heme chaperone HemW [Synergistaceae bacterium]
MTAGSVYIHVPFCESKCPYCAFKSAPKGDGDEELYVESVRREISRRSSEIGPIDTLYVGGGTPTALSVGSWRELVNVLESSLSFLDGAEVTVEANPNTLSAEHIRLWGEWRVNRVSVGVQSFSDDELSFLGRLHTALQAEEAVVMCEEAGFCVSLDLMFGLPGASIRDWARSLRRAVGLRPRHISVYQLTIEPGTPFYERKFDLPEGYWQYRYAQWRLPKEGFFQYEISAFASPGYECGHNMNYWADGEYVGIGPAAWSFTNGARRANAASLAEYARMTERGGDAFVFEERIEGERAARQAAVLALRTKKGIDWSVFRSRYGDAFSDAIMRGLAKFPGELITCDERGAALSKKGMRVGDAIWSDII